MEKQPNEFIDCKNYIIDCGQILGATAVRAIRLLTDQHRLGCDRFKWNHLNRESHGKKVRVCQVFIEIPNRLSSCQAER